MSKYIRSTAAQCTAGPIGRALFTQAEWFVAIESIPLGTFLLIISNLLSVAVGTCQCTRLSLPARPILCGAVHSRCTGPGMCCSVHSFSFTCPIRCFVCSIQVLAVGPVGFSEDLLGQRTAQPISADHAANANSGCESRRLHLASELIPTGNRKAISS